MDKKVSEEFDDYEDNKKKPTALTKRDSQDDEDDACVLVDPLIASNGLNHILKEISAPYEIPHYPIEREEHRRVVQQHLTDMTLSNAGMLFCSLLFVSFEIIADFGC